MLEGGVRLRWRSNDRITQFLLRVATSRRPCCSQEQPNSSPEQDDATLCTWDTRSFNSAPETSCFKPEAKSSTGRKCSRTSTIQCTNPKSTIRPHPTPSELAESISLSKCLFPTIALLVTVFVWTNVLMLRLHVEETRCVGHSHMSDNQTWLVGETAFYTVFAAISYHVGPQSKASKPLCE